MVVAETKLATQVLGGVMVVEYLYGSASHVDTGSCLSAASSADVGEDVGLVRVHFEAVRCGVVVQVGEHAGELW